MPLRFILSSIGLGCSVGRGVTSIVMLELGLEQISYIKLRKRWIWFGKQGFEINYRQHPNDALLGFFFVSKQFQAWLDAFSAAGIKIIPSA